MDIKGKEVILPALSFVSTANAVLYNGGIPVFADVDRTTLCLDVDNLHITGKTGCIIPVNFGGIQCEELYDVPVVIDSAHRIEKDNHNDMTCYSFHPIKNLAMPTGGAIAFNGNLSILKARRWCGITDRNGPSYDVNEIGWNYYMNEISAAIGLVQLEKLDTMNKRRLDIARIYHKGLEFPSMPYDENCSYQLYWIRVKNRPDFMRTMLEAGIETGIHYTPIDQFTLYKKTDLPVTDRIAPELVTLPMHCNLTDQDLDFIIKSANS